MTLKDLIRRNKGKTILAGLVCLAAALGFYDLYHPAKKPVNEEYKVVRVLDSSTKEAKQIGLDNRVIEYIGKDNQSHYIYFNNFKGLFDFSADNKIHSVYENRSDTSLTFDQVVKYMLNSDNFYTLHLPREDNVK